MVGSAVGWLRMDQAEEREKSLFEDDDERFTALGYIDSAWVEALEDGVEPDAIAHAALFMALADLVSAHGEEQVAQMVADLPQKVRFGAYTIDRDLH